MRASTYTEKTLKSRKWPIIIAAAAAALADIFVITALGVGGFEPVYFVIPALLLALDAVFIALTAITNFRFRYSAALFAGYALLALLCAVLGVVLCRDAGSGSPLTTAAMALWLVLHIATVAVIVISSLYAAKMKGISFAAAVACTVIILLVAAFYSAFIFDRGVFGQQFGSENRTLTYSYVSQTDSYEVRGALEGNGETAVIPKEFNGKPVSAVNAALFMQEGISGVYLQADPEITVTGVEALEEYAGVYPVIYVDKKDIDVFRTSAYAAADKEESDGLFALTAGAVPCNLDKGEVYVTFKYDAAAYEQAEGKILPTWIGDDGEKFEMSAYEDEFPYVAHSDKTSAEDLYWNDVNFDGRIFSAPLDASGSAIEGQTIEGGASVQVQFEKIYKVYIGEDNDDVFETDASYKNTVVEGRTLGYRYAVPSTANELLSSIPQREGFSVSGWNYSWTETGAVSPIRTSLTSMLSEASSKNSVIVYPQWEVNEAELNVDSTLGGTSFVYGDEIVLNSNAVAPSKDFTLTYAWSNDGGVMSGETGDSLDLGVLTPAQSGSYTVTVTAAAPQITSLKSVTSQKVEVAVDKKTIDFDWELPSEYTGFEQSAVCTPAEGAAVGEDEIKYSVSYGSNYVKNAGNYTVYVAVTGESDELYRVSEASASKAFTIAPAEVSVEWGSTTAFEYNGTAQYPTAKVNGVGDDGTFDATMSGSPVNAGSYTVTASAGANYVLTNPTAQVTINKRDITVGGWQSASFTYNGTQQYPRATSLNDAVTGEESAVLASLIYSVDGGVNAGGSSVSVTLPANSNYYFTSAQSHSYNISKKQVEVTGWNASSFIYNNTPQHPVAVRVSGALADEEDLVISSITYSGEQTNVGSGYTVTPSLNMTNYSLKATSHSFAITQRGVSLEWSAEKSFTYDGTGKTITVVSASGLASGHGLEDLSITYSILSHSGATVTNAGSYTVTATLGNNNYVITNGGEASFSIAKRTATVVWNEESFTYSGSRQNPTAVRVENAIGSDNLLSSLLYNVSGGIHAGNHTVTASTSNDNYNLASATKSYTIAKKGVTLTWDESTTFTYNGSAQYPKVTSANGTVNGEDTEDLKISYSGYGTDAGEYTVTARLGNSDYTITGGATKSYTIKQKGVTLTWESKTFTYNGTAQGPKVESAGDVNVDELNISYSGYGTNAGSHTVTATLGNKNYVIEGGASCKYEITAKQVTLTWKNNGAEFTANGTPQAPEVTADDKNATVTYKYYNKEGNILLEGKPSEAGSYYVLAQATGNYSSDEVRADFTITQPESEQGAE